MGSISNQYAHKILNDLTSNCFISLHFESPMLAGAYASEISGGGYKRTKIGFSEPSSRSVINTTDAKFTGIPETKVVWVAGWNAERNGDIMWMSELKDPVYVLRGGGYVIPAGDIIISI